MAFTRSDVKIVNSEAELNEYVSSFPLPNIGQHVYWEGAERLYVIKRGIDSSADHPTRRAEVIAGQNIDLEIERILIEGAPDFHQPLGLPEDATNNAFVQDKLAATDYISFRNDPPLSESTGHYGVKQLIEIPEDYGSDTYDIPFHDDVKTLCTVARGDGSGNESNITSYNAITNEFEEVRFTRSGVNYEHLSEVQVYHPPTRSFYGVRLNASNILELHQVYWDPSTNNIVSRVVGHEPITLGYTIKGLTAETTYTALDGTHYKARLVGIPKIFVRDPENMELELITWFRYISTTPPGGTETFDNKEFCAYNLLDLEYNDNTNITTIKRNHAPLDDRGGVNLATLLLGSVGYIVYRSSWIDTATENSDRQRNFTAQGLCYVRTGAGENAETSIIGSSGYWTVPDSMLFKRETSGPDEGDATGEILANRDRAPDLAVNSTSGVGYQEFTGDSFIDPPEGHKFSMLLAGFVRSAHEFLFIASKQTSDYTIAASDIELHRFRLMDRQISRLKFIRDDVVEHVDFHSAEVRDIEVSLEKRALVVTESVGDGGTLEAIDADIGPLIDSNSLVGKKVYNATTKLIRKGEASVRTGSADTQRLIIYDPEDNALDVYFSTGATTLVDQTEFETLLADNQMLLFALVQDSENDPQIVFRWEGVKRIITDNTRTAIGYKLTVSFIKAPGKLDFPDLDILSPETGTRPDVRLEAFVPEILSIASSDGGGEATVGEQRISLTPSIFSSGSGTTTITFNNSLAHDSLGFAIKVLQQRTLLTTGTYNTASEILNSVKTNMGYLSFEFKLPEDYDSSKKARLEFETFGFQTDNALATYTKNMRIVSRVEYPYPGNTSLVNDDRKYTDTDNLAFVFNSSRMSDIHTISIILGNDRTDGGLEINGRQLTPGTIVRVLIAAMGREGISGATADKIGTNNAAWGMYENNGFTLVYNYD